MSATIEIIYTEFTTGYTGTPEYVLEFFSNRDVFFSNLSHFHSKHELQLFIELNWQYFNALFKMKEYASIIEEAERLLPCIENGIKRLNAPELKNNWYHGLSFFTGVANYQLKKYKAAVTIFRSLTSIDSANSNYKTWLDHSLAQQRLNVLAIVYLGLAGVAFVGITLLFTAPQYKGIWQVLVILCFVAIMASFSYESFSKYKLKKAKRTM